MRSGAQREAAPGVSVVAASPDTPNRERWQWQASIVEGADDVPDLPDEAKVVTLPLGHSLYGVEPAVLHVAADPEWALPHVDRVALERATVISRRPDEVAVLLVDRGEAVVEGRHRLGIGDVLVLEGDDPLDFSVEGVSATAGMAMARLAAPEGRPIGWVP